jgi:hypothetical protein
VNRWKIPRWLEEEVRSRDDRCVYCGVTFGTPFTRRREMPSWEHIVNNLTIVTRENIALCCIGCNASKGARPLLAWLQTKYCVARGITMTSIAPVARAALDGEQERDSGGSASASHVDQQHQARGVSGEV